MRKHDVRPQRHCINGKDCDADEEHQRKLQDEARVGVQQVQKGASGTQADNPCRLGLVVEVRQIGRSRNIAQATLEDSLDVLPRLQQVMDQNVTLRLVAAKERTNCQHNWSGRLGSSQHGTSEMR